MKRKWEITSRNGCWKVQGGNEPPWPSEILRRDQNTIWLTYHRWHFARSVMPRVRQQGYLVSLDIIGWLVRHKLWQKQVDAITGGGIVRQEHAHLRRGWTQASHPWWDGPYPSLEFLIEWPTSCLVDKWKIWLLDVQCPLQRRSVVYAASPSCHGCNQSESS